MTKKASFLAPLILVALPISAQKPGTPQVPKPPESQLTSASPVQLDPLSVRSLLVATYAKGEPVGTGTAFVVRKNERSYLVTNWHVVSARRPDTGAPMDPMGRFPDEIRILHNQKGRLGHWVFVSEKLINGQNQFLWIEHPLGKKVDVVFLELHNTADVDLYPVDLETRNTRIRLMPTSPVSIVGYPFGLSESGGLPIWKTGSVASDPDIDYDNSPQMLVDCTGRPGMSGSPVYARRIGPYSDGNALIMTQSPTTDRFLGIYAGDIAANTEIGRIWKASAIMTIYDAAP